MIAALLLVLLVACSSTPPRPATYTVKRGDTLYAIAWRHGLDYHDLARWNRIGRDYVIHPGQVLRLTAGGKASATAPVAGKKASAPASTGPKTAVARSAPIQWVWPVTSGNAVFTTRPNGGQGLSIAGRAGQEVLAASTGRVVYSGTGLLGYGQLVIIKHNETYLSAYGHTQSVTVQEGDTVRGGQKIATMGNGPQGTPMLYFEIRIDGSPTNPLSLLPQRP